MNPFRQEAVHVLSAASGIDAAEVDAALVRPPKPEMGDFAFPCFTLAKELKQAPPKIAADIASKIDTSFEFLAECKALGPYINFTVDRTRFAEKILHSAISQGDDVGTSTEGDGKVVAIDYSSPNIAKPFHVGHLRSTIIGSTLYRLYSKLGYQCVGINHLGDWGTQFGKQIVGLKRWGKDEDIYDLGALNKLYVKYHEEEKAEPGLADEAREWFRKQEAGDEEALRLWEGIRETSLEYFKKIYDRLGIEFDHYIGESFFNDKMERMIELAESKKLTSISDGALVIDLEKRGIEVPALLRKADGATLYLTRDLAAAFHRREELQFHKLLYVVGTAQSLHFQQLFTVIDMLGEKWAKDCVHVNFGLVQGMASRKGNVVSLEDLLDEAKSRTLDYMRANVDKRSDVEDEEAVAEAVGIAAIFFGDLGKARIKDYQFSWDRAISFEGDTGPYLMNAHARIAGIIRKCGIEVDPTANVSELTEQDAHNLVSLVSRYGETLTAAAAENEPSVLASYLLDLARGLHASYNSLRVKDQEESVAKARLLLFSVVKNVLASGLRILGITPLERM